MPSRIPDSVTPGRAGEILLDVIRLGDADDLIALLAGVDQSREAITNQQRKRLTRVIVLRLAGLVMRPDYLPGE